MARKKSASFEVLLAEAEEIVEALETGELSLDAALQKYEKGIANLRLCGGLLDAAEEKVKVLVEESGGKLGLEDFETAAEDENEFYAAE